jgi:hypothetical protein
VFISATGRLCALWIVISTAKVGLVDFEALGGLGMTQYVYVRSEDARRSEMSASVSPSELA